MTTLFDREVKRGSAELLILALIENQPRHGYEIGRLIDHRSRGAIRFHLGSLYPMLYRLERRGLIDGRWIEKSGQRRRRYYRITPAGQRFLAEQRGVWKDFIRGLERVAGLGHA
jgi:PadR family transcriptional regulator